MYLGGAFSLSFWGTMDQERWRAINQIFHAALEVAPSDRQNFVALASEGDLNLQAEVELLLKADQDAGNYIDAPLVPDGWLAGAKLPLEPGEVLCGRFRIVRAIAEGGMGHVFEAFDTELGVQVAVKVIRPEIAANSEALARFRQEVRLARRITHPNVCRTFDIERETRVDAKRGTEREFVFLTMEFLEGETLGARIRQSGALPPGEALQVARQVADALQAAHAIGIVHRDIKPANIMLVPAEGTAPRGFRAVVTDFGLARVDPVLSGDNLSAFTQTARPIGTLTYMAPEQLEGATVSAATDIYALGLVLFEIVTGQRAFPSDNFLSGIARRLTGPPPLPEALVPDLSETWRRAIEGCLRARPEERFRSAADVVAVLDGGRRRLPRACAPDKARPATNSSRPWRRIAALAAGVLLVVSLFLGGLRLYKSNADAKVAPGALVYLTQVKNETGEKPFDNLTALLQAGLTQSVQVNLLDQGRVGDILQEMTRPPDSVISEPIAREIAMRAGAPRVVFADMTGRAGSYSLNVDIQQPDATSPSRYRNHWTKSFTWHSSGQTARGAIPQELTDTVRNASDWIRHEVGESADDIARLDAPPEDVTTSNWQALMEYQEAIRLQSTQNTKDAILALQKAVSIDPDFALAYGRLGDLQVAAGDSADGLRSYARSLNLMDIQRLTPRERDRIAGLAAADSGDFQTAAEAFRDYAVNYQHDYLGWFYLSYPLLMMGRKEEGLADLRRSHQMNPKSLSAAAQLGMFDAATGNYEEASTAAKDVLVLGNRGYAAYISGLSAFLQGRYEQAKKDFMELEQARGPGDRARGTLMFAHLAADRGKYAQAAQVLTEGIHHEAEQGNSIDEAAMLLDRASLEVRLHSYSQALDDVDAALKLDRSPERVELAASVLGSSITSAPPSEATLIRERLVQLDSEYRGDELGMYSRLAKLRLHAQALLAEGQWESALNEGRKADALDAPVDDRSYWISILLAAAQHETHTNHRRDLFEEAYRSAAITVLNCGFAWKDPYGHLPGFLADEMGIFLGLAERLGIQDGDVTRVRNSLQRLRAQT